MMDPVVPRGLVGELRRQLGQPTPDGVVSELPGLLVNDEAHGEALWGRQYRVAPILDLVVPEGAGLSVVRRIGQSGGQGPELFGGGGWWIGVLIGDWHHYDAITPRAVYSGRSPMRPDLLQSDGGDNGHDGQRRSGED